VAEATSASLLTSSPQLNSAPTGSELPHSQAAAGSYGEPPIGQLAARRAITHQILICEGPAVEASTLIVLLLAGYRLVLAALLASHGLLLVATAPRRVRRFRRFYLRVVKVRSRDGGRDLGCLGRLLCCATFAACGLTPAAAALAHLSIELVPRLLRILMVGVNRHPRCVDIGKEAGSALAERAHKVVEALTLVGVSGPALAGPLVEEVGHLVAQVSGEGIQALPLVGAKRGPLGIQIVDQARHSLLKGLSELTKFLALRSRLLAMLVVELGELLLRGGAHRAHGRHPIVI
jgi:hypothetical protein